MDISTLLLIVPGISAYANVISIIQRLRRLLCYAISDRQCMRMYSRFKNRTASWIPNSWNSLQQRWKSSCTRNGQFARIIRRKIKSMERKFILNSKLSPKHRSKHSACPGHLDAITKAIGIGKYLIGAGWRKGEARQGGCWNEREEEAPGVSESSSSRFDIRQICPWSMRAVQRRLIKDADTRAPCTPLR